MSERVAIQVKDLQKTFKIPLEASNGLKQKLINTLKGRKGYREFMPLKDVSFEIERGDFFGIVGRNGSGKSTLLKTIAGIYAPEKGLIQVNGKLVPFIELGVGFNPELTGRENVFLNGALLGFSHREMEKMYDDIVEFAELEDFMEERLKNYSSGMQVRLAFSIAIRAEGDILLLDEVLAVGDEAFQRKCFNYFEELKEKGKTVVLVTHSMSAVERFCNKALFLHDGRVKAVGDPYKIAGMYSRDNDERYSKSRAKAEATEAKKEAEKKTEPKTKIKTQILSDDGKKTSTFTSGDIMHVRLSWPQDKVQSVGVAIIKKSGEYVFGPNTFQDKVKLKEDQKYFDYFVKLDIGEGDYFIKSGLFGKNDADRIDFQEKGPEFTVNRDSSSNRWGGLAKLRYSWSENSIETVE